MLGNFFFLKKIQPVDSIREKNYLIRTFYILKILFLYLELFINRINNSNRSTCPPDEEHGFYGELDQVECHLMQCISDVSGLEYCSHFHTYLSVG